VNGFYFNDLRKNKGLRRKKIDVEYIKDARVTANSF